MGISYGLSFSAMTMAKFLYAKPTMIPKKCILPFFAAKKENIYLQRFFGNWRAISILFGQSRVSRLFNEYKMTHFCRSEKCLNLRSKGDPDDSISEVRHRPSAGQAQLGGVTTSRSARLQMIILKLFDGSPDQLLFHNRIPIYDFSLLFLIAISCLERENND